MISTKTAMPIKATNTPAAPAACRASSTSKMLSSPRSNACQLWRSWRSSAPWIGVEGCQHEEQHPERAGHALHGRKGPRGAPCGGPYGDPPPWYPAGPGGTGQAGGGPDAGGPLGHAVPAGGGGAAHPGPAGGCVPHAWAGGAGGGGGSGADVGGGGAGHEGGGAGNCGSGGCWVTGPRQREPGTRGSGRHSVGVTAWVRSQGPRRGRTIATGWCRSRRRWWTRRDRRARRCASRRRHLAGTGPGTSSGANDRQQVGVGAAGGEQLVVVARPRRRGRRRSRRCGRRGGRSGAGAR